MVVIRYKVRSKAIEAVPCPLMMVRFGNFQGKPNQAWAEEAVKWGADFLVNSVEEDQVLLHIGDIAADHSYFGRPEYYPLDIDRNIQICAAGVCP